MSTKPDQDTPTEPTAEMVARAWHAFSDEAVQGIAFGSTRCECRQHASQAKWVLGLFTGQPVIEPSGLGAVVVNPLTGKVYVRDAHPALPWHNPDENAPEQWSDPTNEDWFVWEDLPRSLVVQSPGWWCRARPSSRRAGSRPSRLVSEPSSSTPTTRYGCGSTTAPCPGSGQTPPTPAPTGSPTGKGSRSRSASARTDGSGRDSPMKGRSSQVEGLIQDSTNAFARSNSWSPVMRLNALVRPV